MVGKLLGGGLVLLGTALWCRGEIQARRRETDRAAELAAALGEMAAEIRSLRRPMPRLLERQARRSLCGGCFARVLSGLERGQPLQDAWEDGFRELTPPEAAGILRDTELTGDEERIVSALTAAVHRLEEPPGQPPAGAAFVGGGPVRGGAVHHLTDIEDDTWMWI